MPELKPPCLAVENYQMGCHAELWPVFYSAIHEVCREHYTQVQIRAWAPDNLDKGIWKNKMEAIKPFVARIDGRVAGYADIQADGLIDHFFVHADYQRMGVGRALMHKILESGAAMPQLYSHVSITAKPFYSHYGFRATQENRPLIRGVALTNYLMKKTPL